MELEGLVLAVQEWARERHLNKASYTMQALKLTEEVGELAAGIVRHSGPDIVDAIGDITVVLIVLCEQIGVPFDKCLNLAYQSIKNRTGRIVDGVFVKTEDLDGSRGTGGIGF